MKKQIHLIEDIGKGIEIKQLKQKGEHQDANWSEEKFLNGKPSDRIATDQNTDSSQ